MVELEEFRYGTSNVEIVVSYLVRPSPIYHTLRAFTFAYNMMDVTHASRGSVCGSRDLSTAT